VARPEGIPAPEHFELVDDVVREPVDGEVLLRNDYLSIVPAMRGWVSAEKNYATQVAVGDVMRSAALATVLRSQHPDYREGDRVVGAFGWQEFATVPGGSNGPIDFKVDPAFMSDIPETSLLGVLGLTGLTAYFGLLEIGRPLPGDTVVVSSAAGSVGSCVGQIAKISGCRVVGIAGGPEKLRLCTEEYGFDAAVDYKAADFEPALARACQGGVDVYFDNTAGGISDAVMRHINVGARVIVCGTAAVSSWSGQVMGPRVERKLLVQRASMRGMLVYDYRQQFDRARDRLRDWVRDGRIRFQEDVLDGIESTLDSISRLYRGDNRGKLLVRLTRNP